MPFPLSQIQLEETIEDPQVIAPTGGGTVAFPAITVPDPLFGTYSLGLAITNLDGITIAGIALNASLITAT